MASQNSVLEEIRQYCNRNIGDTIKASEVDKYLESVNNGTWGKKTMKSLTILNKLSRLEYLETVENHVFVPILRIPYLTIPQFNKL